MKRVLITGATGFVGANLTRRLLRDGHEVHALVRVGHKRWRLADVCNRIQFHRVDFRDAYLLERMVENIKPHWVFHLATHGGYSWQNHWGRIVDTNVYGTMALAGACVKVGFEAFVNAGSSSEYGLKDHAPSESEMLEPNSCYAVTKAAATMYCRYLAHRESCWMPTLRLYSVFGRWEDPQRLFPRLISHGRLGELPPLASPDIARDFVYVDDVVEAFLAAAAGRSPDRGAVYNVGTGVQTALREVVEVARRLLNIKAEPQWNSMANRSWDTNVWVADNARIAAELGWRPRVSLAQGLERMISE